LFSAAFKLGDDDDDDDEGLFSSGDFSEAASLREAQEPDKGNKAKITRETTETTTKYHDQDRR